MVYKLQVKKIVLLNVVLYSWGFLQAAQPVHMHRVFHHTGTAAASSKNSSLEIAQIVAYFDREPMINKGRHDVQKDHKRLEIFFPGAQLKGLKPEDLKKELNAEDRTTVYSAQFEQTAVGVKCAVVYDTKKVVFDYDTFFSISSQHAVRLHFYNKDLLDAMNKSQALLRTASVQKQPCIIIDCGHGGKDSGALGCGNVCEKDITLAVGKEVAQLLQERGFAVCMTRSDDQDLSLDARTRIANKAGVPSALVSIHTNASNNPHASGIETFCLASNLFSKKEHGSNSGYAGLVASVHEQCYNKGQRLAQLLHKHVLGVAKTLYSAHDRSIKHAAAQVLLGSAVPATLIEIGFLSNPQEAALLADQRYQKLVAQGICNGIIAYCATCSV